MVVLIKKKGEPQEALFRKLSKINYEENLVEELRDRKMYRKPSVDRKEINELRDRRKKARKRFAHIPNKHVTSRRRHTTGHQHKG